MLHLTIFQVDGTREIPTEEYLEALDTYSKCKGRITSLIKVKETQQRKLSVTDINVARSAFAKAASTYNKLIDDLKTVDDNVKKLDIAIKHRTKKWKEFRNFISRQVSDEFNTFMGRRDASGHVVLNHEGNSLEIEVCFIICSLSLSLSISQINTV